MKEADWKRRYEIAYNKLMDNTSICSENKAIFKEFFKYQEEKLEIINGLRKLDSGTYRTLYGYIVKFRQVNKWFNNKPWKQLTEGDIKVVYDGLRKGDIKRIDGKPYENLQDSYFSKVFKSKPFELAGVAEIAKKVIQYNGRRQEVVRFITEEDFKRILEHTYKPHHRLLLWLAWDIGENINSLLRLKKSDFTLQKNPHTKEDEYRVNLRKEILKRSRKPRSEITNHNTTVKLLKPYLKDLEEHQELFNFGYRNAEKIVDRAVSRAKVKCIPNGEKTTWKDLRSGMACDLLKKGWTIDEINARLGHKPSSAEIDKYVNFLAIDRHRPKKKVHEFEMGKLQEELKEIKERERLQVLRNDELQKKVKAALAIMEKNKDIILNLRVNGKPIVKKVGGVYKANIK